MKFCPGDRTHFELISRSGFRDVVAFHPGVTTNSQEEFDTRFLAGLGAGQVATQKRCVEVFDPDCQSATARKKQILVRQSQLASGLSTWRLRNGERSRLS